MIRINLLPHREEKRKRQRIQFAVLAGLALVLGIVIVAAVHIAIATQVEYQGRRNNYLKQEIAHLDKQIEEIKKLKEQTLALLARKKVVETLQTNHSEVVHLLDELARQLPDGVYLKAVKQSAAKINLVGYAQSNARVSTLMRNLEASPWLESPSLVEIKAANVNNVRLSEFILDVNLTRQAVELAKPAGAAKAAAPKPAAPAGGEVKKP